MTDDVRLKAVGIDECIDNGGDCRSCAIAKRCKEYLASLKDQREEYLASRSEQREAMVEQSDDELLKTAASVHSFGRMVRDLRLFGGRRN